MGMPLQITLFFASVAVVIFVAYCILVMLQLRKQAERITQTLAELKAEVSPLIRDSRTVLYSINELSQRAHEQCDDIEQVIKTVRSWTERVDHVVEEVGAVLEPPILTVVRNSWILLSYGTHVLEPPILTVVRNAQIIRKGIAKLFEIFLNRNHHQPQETED